MCVDFEVVVGWKTFITDFVVDCNTYVKNLHVFNKLTLEEFLVLFSWLGILWSKSTAQRGSGVKKGAACISKRSKKCTTEKTIRNIC